MVINHNMSSMYANRQIGLNETAVAGEMEKLSSGERINRAADDASGLAVSEKMRAQIRGLNKASENVGNGISFLQTTEGYLTETTDILQRVRELAVQSANGIYTDEDRAQIQVEVSQLVSEVDRIASQAQFNGMNMLTGRFAESPLTLQIGANVDQSMKINVNAVTAEKLGLKGTQETAGISIATPEDANNALSIVDTALTTVTKERANLGAYQNRLEMAQKGIDIAAENTQASESKIRDTDMASAMVDFTKDSILTQASVAMLGQANANSAGVLQLLK